MLNSNNLQVEADHKIAKIGADAARLSALLLCEYEECRDEAVQHEDVEHERDHEDHVRHQAGHAVGGGIESDIKEREVFAIPPEEDPRDGKHES